MSTNDDDLRRAALLLVSSLADHRSPAARERAIVTAHNVGCTVGEIAEQAGMSQRAARRIIDTYNTLN